MTYLCTWPACKTAGCVDCNEAVELVDEDDGAWCDRCNGDGMDPMCDYLLPCPLCQGEQRP